MVQRVSNKHIQGDMSRSSTVLDKLGQLLIFLFIFQVADKACALKGLGMATEVTMETSAHPLESASIIANASQ